nr:hypothetical protein [uncultured Mediterranean phage uvMED]|tara:strand:+ start:2523 stop:3068 length:546 start_codon:yes stop_codon:yes gene_type:complete
MDTETPEIKVQRVLIQPSIYELIMNKVPEHKRHLPLSPIVNDLIYDHLNPCVTLDKPRTEESEWAKVYPSNNIKDKEKKYTDEFEKFWKIYRSAPKGVNSPKKNRAKEEFLLLAKKGVDVQLIIQAAGIAVRDQRLAIECDDDCLCLPDAFRWLRDGVYESLLDEAATLPQQYNSNKPTIL